MSTHPLKKITSLWIITIIVLFVSAIVFGIVIRMNQGKDIDEATMTQLKEQVWNSMVQRTLLFQEIAKL